MRNTQNPIKWFQHLRWNVAPPLNGFSFTIFLTNSKTELHGNNNAKSIVLPGRNIQLGQPRNHLKEKDKRIFFLFLLAQKKYIASSNKNDNRVFR